MIKKITLCILAILFSANVFAEEGKIVFSKSPIDVTAGQTLPSTTFQVGEKIYCRIYLPKFLYKYKNIDAGRATFFRATAYFENEPDIKYNVYTYKCKSDEEAKNTTFEFIFNKDSYSDGVENPKFLGKINAMQPGNYKIIVEVKPYPDAKSMAIGDFTLVKATNSEAVKTGTKFDDIKSGMVDATLEAEALKTLKEYKPLMGARPYSKPNLNSNKIKIISKDWQMTRNSNSGVITHRHIYVAVSHKDSKTGICYALVYCLFQNYTGGSFQKTFTEAAIASAADFLGANSGNEYIIDCE